MGQSVGLSSGLVVSRVLVRAECNLVVDRVDSVFVGFTGESGASIVVGVGVSGWAGFLQPLELGLDVVGPVVVGVFTLLSGGVAW